MPKKKDHALHHISDHNTTAREHVPHAVYKAAKSINANGQKSLEASKYYSDAKGKIG